MGLEYKLRIPNSSEALPGRPEVVPVPANHFVNGNQLLPPFPSNFQQMVKIMPKYNLNKIDLQK